MVLRRLLLANSIIFEKGRRLQKDVSPDLEIPQRTTWFIRCDPDPIEEAGRYASTLDLPFFDSVRFAIPGSFLDDECFDFGGRWQWASTFMQVEPTNELPRKVVDVGGRDSEGRRSLTIYPGRRSQPLIWVASQTGNAPASRPDITVMDLLALARRFLRTSASPMLRAAIGFRERRTRSGTPRTARSPWINAERPLLLQPLLQLSVTPVA